MHIMEILQQQYKIFLDADGVLVNFDKKMREIGFEPDPAEQNAKEKREFWKTVGEMAKRGVPFWGDMEPLADANVLWNYVQRYKPEILTATGHVGNAEAEKRDWFKRHYGNVVVHTVRKSSDKAAFAGPNVILIDDRDKSIAPWVAAGGIGILHKSAADTIRQLKELGL